MKILLVEDDPSTRELLAFHLTAARYTVEQAIDGNTALELAVLWNYDLIILDLNLPYLDGLSLCRQLRLQGVTTPILILTAQTGDANIITGLDAGADDYVTKPFEVKGVLARVRALLRRGTLATAMPSLVWGRLCLDPALAQVTYAGQVVPLTPKEYSLLELFLRYPQRVFSRSTILDHLWTIDDSPTEGAVTNLVKDLRNRLRRSGITEPVIQTVYGLGYRLRELPPSEAGMITPQEGPPLEIAPIEVAPREVTRDRQEKADLPSRALPAGASSGSAIPKAEGLERITSRFWDSLESRLALLEEAIQQLQAGTLSPSQQRLAQDEAHRLVGGLGTFGNAQGSIYAHQIEQLLQIEMPLSPSQVDQVCRGFQALQQTLTLPTSEAGSPNTVSGCRIMVLNLEAALISQLRQLVTPRGWQLEVAQGGHADIIHQLAQVDGVILALDQGVPLAQKLAPLRDMRDQYPQVPILVLTPHDSLEERVQVARLQVSCYLAMPVPASRVFDALDQMLPCAQPPESRVLVVDNDPVTQATIAELLTPWGLRVVGLDQPQQFWETLREAQPDLLLLALDMPTFSGIELCQVVRQDPQYGNLPTLMLAAHPDTVTVRQVFEAGGDDLIGKPIVGPELVTRVLSRIERSRLRQQIDHMRQQQSIYWSQPTNQDPLTQVANSSHFDAFLQQQWDRHCQDHAPISLVLCDIDDFTAYQQVYGQQASDGVLRRIARTLHHTINPNIDLVARYGDSEFGIVLPNTNLDGALRVVSRLQQAVKQLQIPHGAANHRRHITLSFGIGGTTPQSSLRLERLLKTTDQALKDAKARGGNTFCLYPL